MAMAPQMGRGQKGSLLPCDENDKPCCSSLHCAGSRGSASLPSCQLVCLLAQCVNHCSPQIPQLRHRDFFVQPEFPSREQRPAGFLRWVPAPRVGQWAGKGLASTSCCGSGLNIAPMGWLRGGGPL